MVKTDPKEAMVGAIAVWEFPNTLGGGTVIVRAVLPDRIIVEGANLGKKTSSFRYLLDGQRYSTEVTDCWGKPTILAIKYDEIDKQGNSVKFVGYIWPVRQADYDQDPAKYRVTPSEEPLYKGFSEYWWSTYLFKEFDKIAPAPGVNWHGNPFSWVDSAKAAGWVTKAETKEAMVGALLIRSNLAAKFLEIGIVREVQPDGVVIESRYNNLVSYTQTLSFEDMKLDKNGRAFSGYIWPVRAE